MLKEKLFDEIVQKNLQQLSGRLNSTINNGYDARIVYLPCIIEINQEGVIHCLTNRNGELIANYNAQSRAIDAENRLKEKRRKGNE